MESKRELRKYFQSLRRNISAKQKEVWDEKILNKLLLEINNANNIAIFHPLKDEINLLNIVTKFSGKILLPKINSQNYLDFFDLNSPLTRHHKYNIMEPQASNKQKPEIIICPLLAFDNNKYRLGYGGGYYDRTIKHHPKAKTIGVAYKFQHISQLPNENYDQKLDMIITD